MSVDKAYEAPEYRLEDLPLDLPGPVFTTQREPCPTCPEGCENVRPPYCHCLNCSETGVPLDSVGSCDSCRAADVVEELEEGLSNGS